MRWRGSGFSRYPGPVRVAQASPHEAVRRAGEADRAGGGTVCGGGARRRVSRGGEQLPRAGARGPRLMEVVRTVASLRERLQAARRSGASVGLVPTMGAFHEGHLTLMRRARA